MQVVGNTASLHGHPGLSACAMVPSNQISRAHDALCDSGELPLTVQQFVRGCSSPGSPSAPSSAMAVTHEGTTHSLECFPGGIDGWSPRQDKAPAAGGALLVRSEVQVPDTWVLSGGNQWGPTVVYLQDGYEVRQPRRPVTSPDHV